MAQPSYVLEQTGSGLPVQNLPSEAAQGFLNSPILYYILVAAAWTFFGIALLNGIRFIIWHFARIRYTFRRKILLVRLPKEAEEEAKRKEVVDQKKDIKEVIAVMETLYASLAGIKRLHDWKYIFYKIRRFFRGSHRHISFEVVLHEGLVKFFVVVRNDLAEYVEKQIHAEFPSAQVEEVPDYNIFNAQGIIRGTYLKCTKTSILPLKTYKKLDGDPMEGILNTFSKLKKDEGVAIQILLRPASGDYRKQAMMIEQRLDKGDKLEKAISANSSFTDWLIKIMLFPITVLTYIIKEFISKKGDAQKEMQNEKNLPVRLYQREEEIKKGIEEKFTKVNFETNIRVLTSASNEIRAQQILRDMLGAFSQFTAHESGNGFKERIIFLKSMLIHDFIYRNFREWKKVILSSEELASICHFPSPAAETPNILWLQARTSPPPVDLPENGILLGHAVYRGETHDVRLQEEDRRRHLYIIGMTGSGKSVLMSNLAIQDIKAGHGVCIVDPHGTLVEDVLPHIPKERVDDVIYFNPADIERPIGLNMLEADNPMQMDFAVQEMIAIFYKLVTDPSMIGPMFEHNMRNAMLTLMADKEFPGSIADIPRIFTDTDFQKYKLSKVTDPMVRAFWEKEMAKTSDFHKSEMLGYLISKVGRFVENEMIRNIIGQPKSGFNFREVMDKKKILLINLSKGQVGEVNSNLLGLIAVSKLQMAALTRADLPESERNDFYLYIDEFQNFITDSISTILAEARKYRLDLIMAHQYIGQLAGGGIEGKQGNSKVKDAIFGNVGTIVSFRIGVDDAETMAKQFAPTLNEYDVMNVERYHAYIRLLINNTASRPFTMKTVAPQKGDTSIVDAVKTLSRLKYGRDRTLVNAEILERTKLGESEKKAIRPDIEPTL
ncbi:MAG: hypothetical protein UX10_C0009G0007 [Candidatus Magasanikbacteria bacterium GW2011_GWA2_45_39]|uniref:Uncharacterized protein n=2 Tax=Candidatus Magasanikiibacteriota TaxID=1752731 RepID=A0A0G1N0P3_9BACT|nr:MAG: hypothetical protein UX10_C0009G0007 [Candidatus Magasanikbacteria bacterium GW2011_GWA2_45_39]KKU14181.1 MAG: hypothetical protein UX20_C0004G0008 [Candidatus Magasanikbacteria bacterium GW2011_GWC2_45_8]HBW74027.1 hypothetical protein [Candidatus Magasanikbacteria bacterium]